MCIRDRRDETFGIASLDICSGSFQINEVFSEDIFLSEIERLSPKEIIISDSFSASKMLDPNICVNQKSLWEFDLDLAEKTLNSHFGTRDLTAFGCDDMKLGISAAGCLLKYAMDTQRNDLSHIQKIVHQILMLIKTNLMAQMVSSSLGVTEISDLNLETYLRLNPSYNC